MAINESAHVNAPDKYRIGHHYDIGDRFVFFTFDDSNISAVELAVYLQFKAEELFDSSICLDNLIVVKFLTLFGAKEISQKVVNFKEIDMHHDREERCGDWYNSSYKAFDQEFGGQAETFLKQSRDTLEGYES
ncbi:hypothetical protein [Microbulbifer epialgicus]|uniref:Immunity protein 8 n=1 Tax=Microbulbifer epialgicus TaxID=393907 RepID=A0ABV4NU10_9GAMM